MDVTSMPARRPRPRTTADWSHVSDGGHAVQFYAHDQILIDLLGRYVGTALVSGDAAVVIATRAHRDGLEQHLRARGLDTSVAIGERRYVCIDADDMTREVMAGTRPDRDLFLERAGDAIARAAGDDRRRVAVFGEMVALLWTARLAEAAIKLETYWNELAQSRSFSLCCAYPMGGFADLNDTGPFLRVCAQHSHVFPAERRIRSAAR
jgi:hypothetical protein